MLTQIEGQPCIRVFPVRTLWTPNDDMAFTGYPPLPEFQPGTPDTPVMVSCTFKWLRKRTEEVARAWHDYYKNVSIGGPAYGAEGGEFVPGKFIKAGCTITSRGCPKNCGWCDVHKREGGLRELKTIHPGWIVQDNNLLACSERHLRAVFEMLREQKRNIFFNGGLDKDYLKPWHRKELFDSIPIGELWFACDTMRDLPRLEKISPILEGIPQRKLRCYTMIGYEDSSYKETVAEAEKRCERVFELGFMPFAQLWQPDEGVKIYSEEWRKVRRKWSRPAAMFAKPTIKETIDLFSDNESEMSDYANLPI